MTESDIERMVRNRDGSDYHGRRLEQKLADPEFRKEYEHELEYQKKEQERRKRRQELIERHGEDD